MTARTTARLLLAALDRGQRRDLALGLRTQALPVAEQLLVEQRKQQMVGRDLGIATPARDVLCCRYRLLALDRHPVEVHLRPLLLSSNRWWLGGR